MLFGVAICCIAMFCEAVSGINSCYYIECNDLYYCVGVELSDVCVLPCLCYVS